MKLTIGENIREYRKKHGLTQEELAERSGLISNTIYRYEAGERGMSFANAVKLADAMNVSVADFVPQKDKEKTKFISCQQVLDVFFQLEYRRYKMNHCKTIAMGKLL